MPHEKIGPGAGYAGGRVATLVGWRDSSQNTPPTDGFQGPIARVVVRKLVRRYGLPESVAKTVAFLAGLGGRP